MSHGGGWESAGEWQRWSITEEPGERRQPGVRDTHGRWGGGPAFAHQAQPERAGIEHPTRHWPGPQWERRVGPIRPLSSHGREGPGRPHGPLNTALPTLGWTKLCQPDHSCSWATVGLLPPFSVAVKLGLPVGKPMCLGLICQALRALHHSIPHARCKARVFCCLSPRGPKRHSPEICFVCSYQMSWLSARKSWEKTMNSQPLEKQFAVWMEKNTKH